MHLSENRGVPVRVRVSPSGQNRDRPRVQAYPAATWSLIPTLLAETKRTSFFTDVAFPTDDAEVQRFHEATTVGGYRSNGSPGEHPRYHPATTSPTSSIPTATRSKSSTTTGANWVVVSGSAGRARPSAASIATPRAGVGVLQSAASSGRDRCGWRAGARAGLAHRVPDRRRGERRGDRAQNRERPRGGRPGRGGRPVLRRPGRRRRRRPRA